MLVEIARIRIAKIRNEARYSEKDLKELGLNNKENNNYVVGEMLGWERIR